MHDRLAAHVFAAAEHQRRLVGIGEALDMADEDDVVAAVMAELVAAFEMRRRADHDRRAAFRDDVIDIGELVLDRLGESVRQLDLVVGQDVDDRNASFPGTPAGCSRRASCDHSTSGGVSDTEVNEFAVMPVSMPLRLRVVMIVTPVANEPSALRSSRVLNPSAEVLWTGA